jgi:hypothetical protein
MNDHESHSKDKDQDGHRQSHEEAASEKPEDYKNYQSMCTDVVIDNLKVRVYIRLL